MQGPRHLDRHLLPGRPEEQAVSRGDKNSSKQKKVQSADCTFFYPSMAELNSQPVKE